MLRAIAAFLFVLFAVPASAQSCPDFFRFVDFGLEGRDGALHRGGVIFRGESLSGRALLFRDRTECLDVARISTDGHGNPIPVASRIEYDPAKLDLELLGLSVDVVEDAIGAAEDNARQHRTRVDTSDSEITRGANFLCARANGTEDFSCQVPSPFPGNVALVIYCNAQACRMPVLAFDERIAIGAEWKPEAAHLSAPESAGTAILQKVEAIHAFFEAMT